MSTKAKIITGYTDHMDCFRIESVYYQHYDGYTENVLPKLQEIFKLDSGKSLDEEFEKLEHIDDITGGDFLYYIDASNRNKVRCTILEFDWEFFSKYLVESYKVVEELIL